MAPERDQPPGAAPDKGAPAGRIWPVVVVALAVIAAIAIAFMVGRTTVPQPGQNRIGEPAGGGSPAQAVTPGGPGAAGQAQKADTDGSGGPRAMGADFLITDRLLARPATYEELQNETVSTSVCLGQPLRIGNVSSRRVGLIDTPDESDASAELGFVDPGAVFTMVPQEAGTFFVSGAGLDGLLFRYSAERCPPGRSRP